MAKRTWERGTVIVSGSEDARKFSEAASLLASASTSLHNDALIADIMAKTNVDLERRTALTYRDLVLTVIDQLEQGVDMLTEAIGDTEIVGAKPLDNE